MFSQIITAARANLDKRRRYNQLVAEINAFSSRDLADMRADRSEMLHQVRRQIYG